jgi:hypothetical protein
MQLTNVNGPFAFPYRRPEHALLRPYYERIGRAAVSRARSRMRASAVDH